MYVRMYIYIYIHIHTYMVTSCTADAVLHGLTLVGLLPEIPAEDLQGHLAGNTTIETTNKMEHYILNK